MYAHSYYKNIDERYASSGRKEHTLTGLSSCWNCIHLYSYVYERSTGKQLYTEFKQTLDRQYYSLDFHTYNINKEICDEWINFLIEFGLPIKTTVNEQAKEFEIDVIIQDLHSVTERKLVSYLIRYLGLYFTAGYSHLSNDDPRYKNYNPQLFVPTILDLHHTFPKMSLLKCIILGSLIGYGGGNNGIRSIFYNRTLNIYEVPVYTNVKEFMEKLHTMEQPDTNISNCMHNMFPFIVNSTPDFITIKEALFDKDYKTALETFNATNKKYKETLKQPETV